MKHACIHSCGVHAEHVLPLCLLCTVLLRGAVCVAVFHAGWVSDAVSSLGGVCAFGSLKVPEA